MNDRLIRDIASALADFEANGGSSMFPVNERRKYAELGYTIHNPGKMPCYLDEEEWMRDSFVATKGDEALISLLHAKVYGNGAWSRLFRRLVQERKLIQVIEPLGVFAEILKRQGFTGPYIDGHGFRDTVMHFRYDARSK